MITTTRSARVSRVVLKPAGSKRQSGLLKSTTKVVAWWLNSLFHQAKHWITHCQQSQRVEAILRVGDDRAGEKQQRAEQRECSRSEEHTSELQSPYVIS